MRMDEDQQYFKQYLKNKPTDKFAWYLLGREYLAKGEEGKAAYCFLQAGEVYEAFETAGHPDEQTLDQEHHQQAPRRLTRLLKRTGMAMLFLILLFVPSIHPGTEPVQTGGSDDSIIQDAVQPNPDPERFIKLDPGFGFTYLKHAGMKEQYQNALYEMIGPREKAYEQHLLLAGDLSSDKRWDIWPVLPKLLLAVQSGLEDSRVTIRYYDAETCQCEPGDGQSYQSAILKWKRESEEALVLESALAAYEALHGQRPEQLEQLFLPYPNNILSGVTPYMREIYAQSEFSNQGAKGAGQGQVQVAPADEQHSGSQPGSAARPPFTEPLSIIVDRDKYLLALVSGTTIIRSYPIGLGGDRTPEGGFVISEKVRNPNGRSDGDFGSRGMTLSDTLYAIHGTNEPDSIGMDESLGCIRMHNEDIEELFDMVPMNTKVTIGRNLLPDLLSEDSETEHEVFRLPSLNVEENPNKVYKWLN